MFVTTDLRLLDTPSVWLYCSKAKATSFPDGFTENSRFTLSSKKIKKTLVFALAVNEPLILIDFRYFS